LKKMLRIKALSNEWQIERFFGEVERSREVRLSCKA